MKLYDSVGPNPKAVRMFMAELGIELDTQQVDIMAGENRQADYLKLNPGGQCPALALDDGSVISEITVICEYLDEHYGASELIGRSPQERAQTRMWVRRIDQAILENLANGFRYAEGAALFEGRMRLIPQAATDLKLIAQEKITWLDGQMAGHSFVCGSRFSLADIVLFAFLEFFAQVGQAINTDNENIVNWYERVKERPSASA